MFKSLFWIPHGSLGRINWPAVIRMWLNSCVLEEKSEPRGPPSINQGNRFVLVKLRLVGIILMFGTGTTQENMQENMCRTKNTPVANTTACTLWSPCTDDGIVMWVTYITGAGTYYYYLLLQRGHATETYERVSETCFQGNWQRCSRMSEPKIFEASETQLNSVKAHLAKRLFG